MRPTDGPNAQDNVSADSCDDVTVGDGYALAPEVDHKEHVPQRRAAEIFAFPSVTTLFQRRRIEAIQYYSSIAERLQSMSDSEWAAHEQECPDFTNRVLGTGRDVNDCLTNQDEIRATNIMLKRSSSDVGSGVATGFASRGNRSTIDSGKRNSLSRERSFAEQKKHRTR